MIFNLELIKEVVRNQKRVVKYIRNEKVKCPVCEMAGLEGDVYVCSTVGEVRHCSCRMCGSNFSAIGEPAKKATKHVKVTAKSDKKQKQKYTGNEKAEEVKQTKKRKAKTTKRAKKSKGKNK